MDEWGPCESREEWLLMFERGLTQQRIADLCRVDVRRVRRAVENRLQQDPRFLDHCLLVHDQPTYQQQVPSPPPTPAARWAASYVATAGHVLRTRSLPSQNGGPHARTLYKWLQYQRALHAAGRLEEKRVEALDKLGPWQGKPRGGLGDHWVRCLSEVAAFLEEHGRLPAYTVGRTDVERNLAAWVSRQRSEYHRGGLAANREHRLDEFLPGWRRH